MTNVIKKNKIRKIIDGCIHHKQKSQKQLYEMFYGFGYAVCKRYAGSKEETEEMVHNGFLKIYKNIDMYDFNKPFETWIRKIFINSAIDYYRKFSVYNQTFGHNESVEDNIIISENTLSKISADEIMKLIKSLSPSYRLAINLYVVEGYSHKEIGKMLNIAEGTSKSNLSKAKQKLARMIEKIDTI